MKTIDCPDKLRCYSNLIAGFANASLEYIVCIQLFADHREVLVFALVKEAGSLPCDPEALCFCQNIEQFFR